MGLKRPEKPLGVSLSDFLVAAQSDGGRMGLIWGVGMLLMSIRLGVTFLEGQPVLPKLPAQIL